MKILFIGDLMGKPGRNLTAGLLPSLKEQYGPFDFIISNCENAAGGKGMTRKVMDELFASGIDILTSGNHIWDKKEFLPVLDEEKRVLRPLNYPPGCPGTGTGVFEKKGKRLRVLNLQGRVFMPVTDCPFRKAEEVLEKERADCPVFVDFHAEATSEKRALGFFLDGKVSCLAGTHTHVQTADEQILPSGTAYITDVGMTGSHLSSIGMEIEPVIGRFLTGLPARFEVAKEGLLLNAVSVTIDDNSFKASEIKRIVAGEE